MHLPIWLQIIVVSLLWGTTNPYINKHTNNNNSSNEKQQHNDDLQNNIKQKNIIQRTIYDMQQLVTNYKFIFFYVINQLGSIYYISMLSTVPISILSPCCNSITFIITAVASYIIGENININKYTIIGSILIITGFVLCLTQDSKVF